MDFLVSYTANVAAEITKYAFAPVGRQCRYVFSYTSIIETLKGKVNNLKTERGKMESKVIEAKKNGEKIFAEVSKWLNDVKEFLEESNTFLDKDIKEVDTKCIKGLFPNLCSRYQLSRKAEKKMVAVEELMKRNNFTKISEYVQPPPIEFTADENSVAFNSRKEIFDEIYASLKHDHIQMTGISGMAGVGKTTLVEQIGKEAGSSRLFDVILLAAISQNPDFSYIQQRFAERMGLTKFDEKTKEERASRLHGILERRLNDGEKILVILDDVWEELKMSDLGIPFSHDDSKSQRSCKIIITSRDENLCNKMGSQKIYKVERLHQNEAWSLFERIVGHDILTIDRRKIASEIIKACGGLPLAINIIASTLRNNDNLDCWKDAIGKIRRANFDRRLSTVLELSYKFLEKESDAQELFLLCSLFREDADIPIWDLLIYGLGWGLFQDTTTLESAFVRINVRVKYLKSTSLLLDGTTKESVKMHDVVREFALAVPSKDRHMFRVEAGSSFDNVARLNLCTSMSLQIREADDFPSKLELPELKLLKLETAFDGPPLVLPYDMIVTMQKLKVLSMYGIRIMSLPQAFKYFQELRTLFFDFCEIEDISIIGELKNLFFLHFHGCNMKALPEEIGKLTKLKILDLSGCEELTLVPSSVMHSLSRLEGLLIGQFEGWAVSAKDNRNTRASLEDLKSLSNLVLLEVHIPDFELWPEDLLFENLMRFKISVGQKFEDWEHFLDSSKILKLQNVDVTHRPLTKGVDVLLQIAEVISMENINGFQNGLYERSDMTCFLESKYLHIENFSKMKYVADATIARCEVFPRLEELRITSLPQLMSILKSPAESAPLQKLRILKVSGCRKLRSIFSQSMVICLLQLVKMEVCECEALEVIVDCESKPEVQHIVFHQLRYLELRRLPNLKSFLSSINALAGANHHAPCVQLGLFQNKVAFPVLERLELEGLDNIRDLWSCKSPVETNERLSDIERFAAEDGETTLTFHRLKVLWVTQLPMLEYLFDKKVAFPVLEKLVLKGLDNIRDLGSCKSPAETNERLSEIENFAAEDGETSLVFHRLKELRVQGLPKLEYLFDEKVAFPVLEILKLEGLDNIRDLWSCKSPVETNERLSDIKRFAAEDGETTLTFHRLKVLWVTQLPKLEYLFDKKVAFPVLEILELEGLDNIRDLWSCKSPVETNERLSDIKRFAAEDGETTLTFHRLNFLCVTQLPKLEYLFDKKVAFPVLERLELEGLDNIRDLWSCKSPVETNERLSDIERFAAEDGETTLTFHRLKVLWVTQLPMLEYLFDKKVAFPVLEILKLEGLDNIRDLWSCKSPVETNERLSDIKRFAAEDGETTLTFHRLKVLWVTQLPKLEYLFDKKVAFPVLELLYVDRLYNIRDLFEIRKFAAEDRETTLVFHHLEQLHVVGLPKLEYLFDKKVSFPALKKLYIEEMEGLPQIWEMQLPPGSFDQLDVIEVTGNPKLLSIVPSNLFQNLLSLRELRVRNCETVKEIIGDAGGGLEHAKVLILRQLQSIELFSLPMLTSFYNHKRDFLCPSLTTVDLRDCHKMETFTYGYLKTPMLKSIQVDANEQWRDDLNSTVQYAYQEHQKKYNRSNDGDKSYGSSERAIDGAAIDQKNDSNDGDKSDGSEDGAINSNDNELTPKKVSDDIACLYSSDDINNETKISHGQNVDQQLQ